MGTLPPPPLSSPPTSIQTERHASPIGPPLCAQRGAVGSAVRVFCPLFRACISWRTGQHPLAACREGDLACAMAALTFDPGPGVEPAPPGARRTGVARSRRPPPGLLRAAGVVIAALFFGKLPPPARAPAAFGRIQHSERRVHTWNAGKPGQKRHIVMRLPSSYDRSLGAVRRVARRTALK